MDYGIKKAKSGYAVDDASPGNYDVHSSYPFLKIKSITEGHAYTTGYANAERAVATIAHSLGYAPMFDLLIGFNSSESTPTNWYPLSFFINYPFLGAFAYINAYTNNDNLIIKYSAEDSSAKYVYYKAVIYYDPVNP